jgi:hypothetical protein
MSVWQGARVHGARDEECALDEAMMEVMMRTRCSGKVEGRATSSARGPPDGQRDDACLCAWSHGRSACMTRWC